MDRTARTTAVVTIIAVVFCSFLPALAATEATLEGTVEIPCDPSRVSDVLAVQIRPVSGGAAVTAAVDASTGKFLTSGLAAGEYELIAIGADGKPLSPEPMRLLLREGPNQVVLSLRPPGCGEQDSTQQPAAKRGLRNWHYTLIYVGVVGAVALALDDDDEEPASPF